MLVLSLFPGTASGRLFIGLLYQPKKALKEFFRS